MEMVYISHPYTGNEEHNKEHAQAIRKSLQYDNPDDCYICPLGMFGDEQDPEYCRTLARCMELESRCDTVVFCAGWEESTGCRAEMALAIMLGLKIDYLGEEG